MASSTKRGLKNLATIGSAFKETDRDIEGKARYWADQYNKELAKLEQLEAKDRAKGREKDGPMTKAQRGTVEKFYKNLQKELAKAPWLAAEEEEHEG